MIYMICHLKTKKKMAAQSLLADPKIVVSLSFPFEQLKVNTNLGITPYLTSYISQVIILTVPSLLGAGLSADFSKTCD